jgi:UDP-glucose 4-epimerase
VRPTLIDDLSTGRTENLSEVRGRFELVEGQLQQLLSENALDLPRFDYVFHLAANPYIPTSVANPALDFSSNLAATFALLEAVRKGSRRPLVVIASSAAVYGDPETLPIRESHPTLPISPYGVSKLGAERYVSVYAALYDVPALSLRLFSAYGPRQRKQVVFDLFTRLLHDPSQLEVIGDGTQERDLSYAGDIADAFLLAAERAPARGEALNVASGQSVSIAELVDAVCRSCGVAPRVRYTGRTRPGDAQRWRVDTQAIRALGFEPRTPLETGLRNVLAWLRSSPFPVDPAPALARTAGA